MAAGKRLYPGVEQCLTAIGCLAQNLDRELYFQADTCDEFHEYALLLIERLRAAINHIGWLADLGCVELTGSAEVRGDAIDWLTTPAFVEHREKAKTLLAAAAGSEA